LEVQSLVSYGKGSWIMKNRLYISARNYISIH
jgi:hypothetical protein